MRDSFLSQIYFVLPTIFWVAFIIYTRLLLNLLHKNKTSSFVNFCAILKNKWITDARCRTVDNRKTRQRNCEMIGMPRCLEVEFLRLVALSFPQFALLHSVTCVQLWLIKILGNCGCVVFASFLGVPTLQSACAMRPRFTVAEITCHFTECCKL
jgi:hypothetical protein